MEGGIEKLKEKSRNKWFKGKLLNMKIKYGCEN